MKPRCSASSTARTAPSSSKVLRGRRSYADGGPTRTAVLRGRRYSRNNRRGRLGITARGETGCAARARRSWARALPEGRGRGLAPSCYRSSARPRRAWGLAFRCLFGVGGNRSGGGGGGWATPTRPLPGKPGSGHVLGPGPLAPAPERRRPPSGTPGRTRRGLSLPWPRRPRPGKGHCVLIPGGVDQARVASMEQPGWGKFQVA